MKQLVKERLNFGDKQLSKVSDIVMGIMNRRHHRLGTEIVIPIRKCYEKGWLKAKTNLHEPVSDKGIKLADIRTQSFADWGVIAYKNGLWNPTNWLERMEG